MSILESLLSEIKTPDLTQQVREICDKIQKEEATKQKWNKIAPKGSLVFLSLEVPGRNAKEVGFLTLEREDVERYIKENNVQFKDPDEEDKSNDDKEEE